MEKYLIERIKEINEEIKEAQDMIEELDDIREINILYNLINRKVGEINSYKDILNRIKKDR